MDKIIGLKHESDLVDLLLSLEEGEEYVMMDEECKRLFQLTELEKSQLGKGLLIFFVRLILIKYHMKTIVKVRNQANLIKKKIS